MDICRIFAPKPRTDIPWKKTDPRKRHGPIPREKEFCGKKRIDEGKEQLARMRGDALEKRENGRRMCRKKGIW